MLAKSFKVNSKAKLSEQICHFFPFLSYNYVMKLLRNKDVKLNGKRVSKDVYVDVNSEVIIYIDDRHIKNEIDIVYEDENVYRVLVGAATTSEALTKIETALQEENIAYYKKELQVKENEELLEDALIETKQAIEMASIYREILSSMTDTYATIISNNLNDVMKFLAGITIVFSIPTMVASFIGMNVPLGRIGSSPMSFIFIILISVLLSLIIAYILKKKNML